MTEQSFIVAGMTCGNCVRHVTEALRALAGVSDVQVELASGRATLRADRTLPEAELRAVLDEAGYSLA